MQDNVILELADAVRLLVSYLVSIQIYMEYLRYSYLDVITC